MMGWFGQGYNSQGTLCPRGTTAKGHFVQGMQHPRIFGRGHIDRGRTNIAPLQAHPLVAATSLVLSLHNPIASPCMVL